MIEDGESLFAMEAEVGFEILPFAIIDLDRKLLGAAIVAAVGHSALFFQVADFLGEFSAFRSPRDEDGMGVGVDEAKGFRCGFEFVGVEACCIGRETGFAGDNLRFVPGGGFGPGLPDGVLEVDADEFGMKEVFIS